MPCQGFYVKDLSRLGRDLSKTIIVDNTPECFLLQPENGIQIKNWYKDPHDTALMELAPLLEQIVKGQVQDVRKALRESKHNLLKMIAEGVLNPTK
jgi:CTD small phosphatase-like protein 2